MTNAGVDELVDDVKNVASRLWTSAICLQNRELCSIFNQAIREDNKEMMPSVATFARGLNMLCVTGGSSSSLVRSVPAVTYRGGALPEEHHHFFGVGKQFRTPQFLSTSGERSVAERFARQVERDPVIWEFRFNQTCRHVNFIARGNVLGEQEFLLTAYSVFTVLSETEFKQHPSTEHPHKVVLEVAPNNLNLGEDLPVSPWFFSFLFLFLFLFSLSFFFSFFLFFFLSFFLFVV